MDMISEYFCLAKKNVRTFLFYLKMKEIFFSKNDSYFFFLFSCTKKHCAFQENVSNGRFVLFEVDIFIKFEKQCLYNKNQITQKH